MRLIIYDCYNHKFRGGVMGTVVPQFSRMDLNHNGYKVIIINKFKSMKLKTFKIGDKECVALVRKLTEKECGRLMGLDDEDIQTIADSGVSRSAQYKMYGNSIVVDVLYHIFRKAFVETENESRQMTIFDLM